MPGWSGTDRVRPASDGFGRLSRRRWEGRRNTAIAVLPSAKHADPSCQKPLWPSRVRHLVHWPASAEVWTALTERGSSELMVIVMPASYTSTWYNMDWHNINNLLSHSSTTCYTAQRKEGAKVER